MTTFGYSHRSWTALIAQLCFIAFTMPLSTSLAGQPEPAERRNTFALAGGMGICAAYVPGITDYIYAYSGGVDRPGDFGTDIDFFGAAEFPVSEEWGIKLEYDYLFKSYTLTPNFGGTYDLFYDVHIPSLLVQYCIPGKGYFLKFGVGGGYHLGTVTQSFPYGSDSVYSANGIGVRAETVGQTAFDEDLFGYIGVHLMWEFLGEAKNEQGKNLRARDVNASLSMFAAGIRFGLMYYF